MRHSNIYLFTEKGNKDSFEGEMEIQYYVIRSSFGSRAGTIIIF